MIEIKHRYTNEVIHKVDADSLQDANLRGANLRAADLQDANLEGADLRYCIGNDREIKTLIALKWCISWTATDLAIGCQQHPIEAWDNFSDEEIDKMANDALAFWKERKALIMGLVKS